MARPRVTIDDIHAALAQRTSVAQSVVAGEQQALRLGDAYAGQLESIRGRVVSISLSYRRAAH